MTWQRNRPYLSRIKSAVDAHQRPTAALLEQPDPINGWTSHDYRLQEAINIMEREVCKTCGNPLWLCHSTDNMIDFQVKVGACYGRAAIEDREEDKSKPKLMAGEYFYAVPVGVENEDGSFEKLPTRLEALSKIG